MFLSIIIPVFNSYKTIEKCLSSIFNSTFNDFEVIVVDDKSTDDCADLLKKFNVEIIKYHQ